MTTAQSGKGGTNWASCKADVTTVSVIVFKAVGFSAIKPRGITPNSGNS